MNYQTADLPSLISAVNDVANEARTTFGQLTPSQLNWKPSPERWSVAQCFDHLLTSHKGYFPVINDFIAQQTKLVEKMNATKNLDLEHIIVTSPALAAITYSLMDGYRIIVAHEHRHFQQAKRVTEETSFPS